MDFPLCANIGKWEKCGELCGHTHTRSTSPLSSCCRCSGGMWCACGYLLLSVCTLCLCVPVRACMYVFCAWGYVVCVCVCGCLCGPTMWQKNSPLTLSPLHWFTWSDLITSKCTTVSAVRSAAARQSDDTVCAVMLDFAPDKGLLHQFLIEWLIKHNSSLGYAAEEWAGQPTHGVPAQDVMSFQEKVNSLWFSAGIRDCVRSPFGLEYESDCYFLCWEFPPQNVTQGSHRSLIGIGRFRFRGKKQELGPWELFLKTGFNWNCSNTYSIYCAYML